MQRQVTEGYRLSPQQRRLWGLQDGSSAFVAQCVVSIEGVLEPEKLALAVRHAVSRHEILRTTFHRPPGVAIPVQVVSERADVSWHHVDLSDRDPEDRRRLVAERILAQRLEPFDFESRPLLRLSLIALTPVSRVLVLSLPALCADARALKNLFEEITSAYASGQSSEEPEELLQYAQFAQWQNDLLEDESGETGRQYWRNKSQYSYTELKFASPAGSGGNAPFAPQSFPVALDPDLVSRLDGIARTQRTTTAVVLLAAWEALLWRLTGEPDIVVGDACDGRDLEMLEAASGLFAKWLPIHCPFNRRSSLNDTVSRIDEARREAHGLHEWFTLDAGANQGDSEPAFFPVGFEFNEFPPSRRADGVTFSLGGYYCDTERFNIKLSCARLGETLTAELYYDPRTFDRGEVGRVASHFRTLLDNALTNGGAAISELELLTPAERHHLLVGVNSAKLSHAHAACLHELFEEQARRTPDRVALAFMDMQVDYAELNSRANRVAHYLRRHGAGPETLVGLCMERSLEMVTGLLGALKAGAAYVPLDPTYPKERLALMMDDMPLLLTRQSALSSLPASAARVVCLDSDWNLIGRESDANPVNAATPESLAYLIYTSGSTGKPRGVMVRHGSVVNLAAALYEAIYARYPTPLRVSLNA
ncbi:MAG TPA: condensation domain-containing protein, partial [Blastocatellia bacterium]|nr:condensation domain-containing protein [Blastocatellia bacterium]